jgi:hypothetical protein
MDAIKFLKFTREISTDKFEIQNLHSNYGIWFNAFRYLYL